MQQFRELNPNKLMIAHISVNSIKNKFDLLSDKMKGNIDILMFSETKIDQSFLTSQFEIDGFDPPFQVNWNQKTGWSMLYIRKDVPA